MVLFFVHWISCIDLEIKSIFACNSRSDCWDESNPSLIIAEFNLSWMAFLLDILMKMKELVNAQTNPRRKHVITTIAVTLVVLKIDQIPPGDDNILSIAVAFEVDDMESFLLSMSLAFIVIPPTRKLRQASSKQLKWKWVCCNLQVSSF